MRSNPILHFVNSSANYRPPTPTVFVLRNGMRVWFAERAASPLAELRLVCNGGFADDAPGRDGCSGLATAILTDSTRKAGELSVAAELWRLGASMRARVAADATIIELSALACNLGEALAVFFRTLSLEEISEETVERARARMLARVTRETLRPADLAARVLPLALFPPGYRYARPFTGSGTKDGLRAVTVRDLSAWRAAHLSPGRSTLIAAGPPETIPILESTFEQWRDSAAFAPPAEKSRGDFPVARAQNQSPEITLIESPNISQSAVFTGIRTPPRNFPAAGGLLIAEAILAGMFTSRLNMNLREDKGWTYGVHSSLFEARLGGWWLIGCFVPADRVHAVVEEIRRELENMGGLGSRSEEELKRAIQYLLARVRSNHETSAQTADALAQIAACALAPDYQEELYGKLPAIRVGEVAETCRDILGARSPRWLIAGDAAKAAE